MTNPTDFDLPVFRPRQPHYALADVADLSKTLHDTVNIAAGLATGRRQVDVTGLDHSVGLLCAKALDLPPVEGRAACALLFSLLNRIDALSVAMQSVDPQPGQVSGQSGCCGSLRN